MAKGRERYEKRLRERARQEKAAAKREKRAERDAEAAEAVDEGPSEDELLERFRVLNERNAAGELTDEEFEAGRAELMEALGFGDPS